jgi:predicted secreted Zn-dependent protease
MDEPVRRSLTWRRSSECTDSSCVEVAMDGELVFLRNSTRSEGVALRFTREEWEVFVAGIRRGEFG